MMLSIMHSKKRSTWKRLLLGLIVVAVLYTGYRFWVVSRYEQELATLLAQIEAEDPAWTWEQRQAARNAIKPEDNGGLELIELLKLSTLRESIPMNSRNEWAKRYMGMHQNDAILYYDSFLEQHPNARLPQQIRVITETLLKIEPVPEVLSRARKMQRFQEGKLDHGYRSLLIMSLLPDVQGTRSICNLLVYHSDLLAESRQAEPAMDSIQGMLGIARCLNQDPFLISLFVRCAIVSQACRQTSRLLAQPVNFTVEQLKDLQEAFAREQQMTQDLLTVMIQRERTMLDYDLRQLAEDKVGFNDIAGSMGLKLKYATGYVPLDQKLVNVFPEMLYGWGNRPGHMKQERLALLRFYTEAVHWSALPEHGLLTALKPWNRQGPFLTPFLRQFHMMPEGKSSNIHPEIDQLEKLAHVYLRNRAHLRAIIAAIACERYRLDMKHWPDAWEQLAPAYLKNVPLDPYTALPLFLKAVPDGLVMYSVGKDMKDDGGNVLPGERPATDLGFRLWNPSQRGIHLDQKYSEYLKQAKQE